MNENVLNDTFGFIKFKPGLVLKMIFACITSNIEIVIFLAISALATYSGGLFNLIIMGIMFFRIFIEEIYGNLTWWRTIYMIYLLKLLLHLLDGAYVGLMTMLLG